MTIRLCVDGRCEEGTLDRVGRSSGLSFQLPDDEVEDTERLEVSIHSGGRHLVSSVARVADMGIETRQPNGPDCPPVCKIRTAVLDENGQLRAPEDDDS